MCLCLHVSLCVHACVCMHVRVFVCVCTKAGQQSCQLTISTYSKPLIVHCVDVITETEMHLLNMQEGQFLHF